MCVCEGMFFMAFNWAWSRPEASVTKLVKKLKTMEGEYKGRQVPPVEAFNLWQAKRKQKEVEKKPK